MADIDTVIHGDCFYSMPCFGPFFSVSACSRLYLVHCAHSVFLLLLCIVLCYSTWTHKLPLGDK